MAVGAAAGYLKPMALLEPQTPAVAVALLVSRKVQTLLVVLVVCQI